VSSDALSIAYFGMPVGILHLARSFGDDLTIRHLWLSRTDSPGTRRVCRLFGDRVRVAPNAKEQERDLAKMTNAPIDLVISWFWVKKLPSPALAWPKLGSVGFHPSLLPRHRGADPVFWAIDCGDEETGVTAHVLGEEYDTGALYASRKLAIRHTNGAGKAGKLHNGFSLAHELDAVSLRLMQDVLQQFVDYKKGLAPLPPKPSAQTEEGASHAPTLTDEELEVDFLWPADRIERRVRAAAPYPGAYAYLGEEAVTLLDVTPCAVPEALRPGECVQLTDGSVAIKTADGGLRVGAARIEGGEERLDAFELGTLLFS
jgi:methionyl-tRNA formyltransferase